MAASSAESFGAQKEVAEFRVYKAEGADGSEGSEGWDAGVRAHYREMRHRQTVEFVDRMEALHLTFDHRVAPLKEMFATLDSFVDRSDPDLTLPNRIHALQAAERARKNGEPDWLVFTALIHDLGKVMFLWGSPEDGSSGKADGPQFALGGDTWVIGCALPAANVFPEFNALNPDAAHPVYGTENGVYAPGCGLFNLRYAFGHDEYVYRWALRNKIDLPLEAYAMLRLHSCYPMHRHGAYARFYGEGDAALLEAVTRFNAYDLYTKADEVALDFEALWTDFYGPLVEKFAPGDLVW